MTISIGRLNYPALLLLPSQEAFLSALSQTYAMDFVKYLANQGLALQPPVAASNADTKLTQAVIHDPQQIVTDATVEYRRMDLGEYLTACTLYISQADAASVASVVAWFLNTHKLYFDPAELAIVSVANPTLDPLLTGLMVTVASGNYVWLGEVVLWVAPGNHLGLRAKPGVATGIRRTDIGLPETA